MDGSEEAEGGVVGDVFDEGFGLGVQQGGGGLGVAGKVGGGDLQGVEEKSGALGVDVGCGDAGHDAVDGELDAGSIVDGGHGEDGLGGVGVPDGGGGLLAGGTVIEAEVLSAKGGRAATAAFGEDVAAEVAACGVGLVLLGKLVVHGGSPWVYG